jgi:AcrR family transcriptional regulator
MRNEKSIDPRARKTRLALHDSFRELLRDKSYSRISVADIAEGADIARHTFYNHYQDKQDLLFSLIDSILGQFFANLDDWNLFLTDPEKELRALSVFFQAWRDQSEIVELLGSDEIELAIMERLKMFFTQFFYDKIREEMPSIDLALANYVIGFNVYSLLGLLIPWFNTGMMDQPEDLAGLYIQLAGSKNRMQAVKSYQRVFTNRSSSTI